MTQHTSFRDFYYDIPSTAAETDPPTAADLKKAFDGLDTKEKERLLLTPLSATTPENSLSYIICDGNISKHTPDNIQWRINYLAAALDEIEKLVPDRDDRVALLTAANEMGQTVFHKALKYGGIPEVFDMLADRLHEWGGHDSANDWLAAFLDKPLGIIDRSVSTSLMYVRADMQESADKQRMGSLCYGNYQPADFEALKAAVDKIRPAILQWFAEDHPQPAPGDRTFSPYKREKLVELEAFAKDPDAVEQGTPFAQAFPGAMFWRLIDGFAPKTSQPLEDYIFNLLSEQNTKGNTPMHREWHLSEHNKDTSLGTFINELESRTSRSAALDTTKRLLWQENNKGRLPLDELQYILSGEDGLKARDVTINAFLRNFREDIGSHEKFVFYVKELIAATLPKGFKVILDDFDPPALPVAGNTKPVTGSMKFERGATVIGP